MSRSWTDAVLARSPLQPLFLWRAARRLTVLAYHGVAEEEPFARQLDWLRSRASVIDAQQLIAALRSRSGLPRRAVLITFDDGDRSLVERGMPLLRDRDLPAVAFVVAGLIDTDQPFWWEEVQELARRGGRTEHAPSLDGRPLVAALKRLPDETRLTAIEELRRTAQPGASPGVPQLRREELRQLESAGITIGNHTLSHPCLHRCSDDTVAVEITDAHRRLESVLGHHPSVFAYPNGSYDARATATLTSLGYDAAFLFDHRLSRFPVADRFAISRVRVNSYTSLDRFRTIVSGLHPALHRLRGRS